MNILKTIAFASLLFMVACTTNKDKVLEKEEAHTIDAMYHKIASDTAQNGLIAELFATVDTLSMGYNPVYFRIVDTDGAVITNYPFKVSSFMGMGGSGHGSPVRQPVYNKTTQLYEGGVSFSMPGKWEIRLASDNDFGAALPLRVASRSDNKVLHDLGMGTDKSFYDISLITTDNWNKGENKISIMVNQGAEDMVNFPGVDNLDIDLYPEPADSTLKSDPSLKSTLKGEGDGIYSGVVQLPTTGVWNLDFVLKKGSDTLVKKARLATEF